MRGYYPDTDKDGLFESFADEDFKEESKMKLIPTCAEGAKVLNPNHQVLTVEDMMKETKKPAYIIVYRQGGTHRFRWCVTIPDTLEGTLKRLEEVKRAGYYAFHTKSCNGQPQHGLPETYSSNESPEEFEFKKGWIHRKKV